MGHMVEVQEFPSDLMFYHELFLRQSHEQFGCLCSFGGLSI